MSETSNPLPLELSAIWPEGLKILTFRMGFAQAELDIAALELELADRELVYRRREADLLFPLRGVGECKGFWGRAEFTPAPEPLSNVADIALEISIQPEQTQPVVPEDSLLLNEFPLMLERVVKGASSEQPVLVSGRFSFDSPAWRPAITLPVQLPGVLDNASGAPEITGYEFTFRDPASELKRAEISIDPYGSKFSVEIFLTMDLLPSTSMINRACHLLGRHLSLMAVRLTPAEITEHV